MTATAFSGQASPSATLNCPNCQTTIAYYDVSGSSFYACPHCHTFFAYEYEGPPQILTQFARATPMPALPIGAEGYLNGQFVRVVGIMHKQERGAPYNWLEYMLLQQNGQTVQLAEFNGHWMRIEPVAPGQSQVFSGGTTYYIDTEAGQYKLYNRYKADLLSAVGEFDWNILKDQELTISEYIQPPAMRILEQAGDRTDWYTARYVSRPELATAFALSLSALPPAQGVGAIEPADPENRMGAVVSFTGIALVAVLVIQIILSVLKPSKQLFHESYLTKSDSSGAVKPIVTPSFKVNGPAALRLDMSAGLDNKWIELPVVLINEQSGRTYEFTKSLAYYHGVESGESWSEGSQDDEATLSRVPSGRYHLNIYPAREPGLPVSFQITVAQNRTIWSNLTVMLVLLLIYPIVLYIRRGWFEGQRWNNSDFFSSQD